jgi:hypothetical protein
MQGTNLRWETSSADCGCQTVLSCEKCISDCAVWGYAPSYTQCHDQQTCCAWYHRGVLYFLRFIQGIKTQYQGNFAQAVLMLGAIAGGVILGLLWSILGGMQSVFSSQHKEAMQNKNILDAIAANLTGASRVHADAPPYSQGSYGGCSGGTSGGSCGSCCGCDGACSSCCGCGSCRGCGSDD